MPCYTALVCSRDEGKHRLSKIVKGDFALFALFVVVVVVLDDDGDDDVL